MEQQLISGRYERLERIGAGGAAQVYLGRDCVLRRQVAVKILHPESAADPHFVERFRREAQAAAALNHMNIATIYDWGPVDNTYFMVMEYVPGRNLKERLREGPLPEGEALNIAAQIADALNAAHEHGVIHRDVKPHNVLIDPNGCVKVVDFGIARATGQSQLTKTNMVPGTAHYLSPEQLQRGALDGRSDVCSLGIVLYEMLTGQEPFRGDSLVEVALQHINDQPVPPRRIQPNVSVQTEEVVLKALAKEPAGRYSTAAEMRDALRAAHSGLVTPMRGERRVIPGAKVSTPQVHPVRPVPRADSVRSSSLPRQRAEPQRRRFQAWLMAVPAILVLLVAGVFLVSRAGAGSKSAAHHAATPVVRHQASPTLHPATHHAGAAATPTAIPAVRPTSAPASAPSLAVPTATFATTVASTQENGPADAVSSFYQSISSGRLDRALSLWTPDMRNSCAPDDCIYRRFENTESISIQNMALEPHDNRNATADVSLIETSKDGSTRSWRGTWYLVNDGSGWLLNAASFQ